MNIYDCSLKIFITPEYKIINPKSFVRDSDREDSYSYNAMEIKALLQQVNLSTEYGNCIWNYRDKRSGIQLARSANSVLESESGKLCLQSE